MSYTSKNPKFSTTTLTDQTSTSVTSAPSGSVKIINRNGQIFVKDSTGAEVLLGSGSGGKNYLSKWSDASVAPGTVSTVAANGNVTVSGSFPDVTSAWYADVTSGSGAITQSSDNTLRGTKNFLTALSGASTSGATFVQTPVFNIDGEDLSKPLTVTFDVAGNTTDDDWDVVAVRYDSSGVFQELLPIAGNVSTTTGTASAKLPLATTTFSGFFLPGSTASNLYSLRFRRRAGSVQIRLDTLTVGPQVSLQAAVVTGWQDYTPTIGAMGTVTNLIAKYAQVGGSIFVKGSFTAGTTTASNFTISLPTNLNFLTGMGNGKQCVGRIEVLKSAVGPNSNAFSDYQALFLDLATSSTTVFAAYQNGSGAYVKNTGSGITSTGNSVNFEFNAPISQWQTGTTTIANRAVEEYVFNTSTATTGNDTTSFGYGFGGNLIPARTAAGNLRCRFQTSILPTDIIVLEINLSGNSSWVPVETYGFNDVAPFIYLNTTQYGIGISRVSGSSTDIDVNFGTYASTYGATTVGGAATQLWSAANSAGTRWRVRKVSGGAAVGYPIGARNIIGDITGTAIPAGLIGEEIRSASTTAGNFAATSTYADVTSITLTPGIWDINAIITYVPNASTTSFFDFFIGTVSGNNSTGRLSSDNQINCGSLSSSNEVTGTLSQYRVLVTTSTTYYLKARASFSAGTPQRTYRISAVRVG